MNLPLSPALAEETSTSFSQLRLSDTLLSTLQSLSLTTPTPIQAAAIPLALAGHDLIGLAQTGTGKTAAFVLPMLERLSIARPTKGVRALILSPTRELADQTLTVIQSLSKKMRVNALAVYGGVSMGRQLDALRRGQDIVVACPGRLYDHMQRRTIDLSNLEMLVLDEADQMFDMGFLPTIRRILKMLPLSRQSLLFSATMRPELEVLAREILKQPKMVRVGTIAPTLTVSHSMYTIIQARKGELLHHVVAGNGGRTAIVFTRTKRTAKVVAERLAARGLAAIALHGNLSQNKRQEALQGFRNGKHTILVATDIAARGLDITGVGQVVNYDMPETLESYTHRIGRTGRAALTGEALSFVTSDDMFLVRQIERSINGPMTRIPFASDPSFPHEPDASLFPPRDNNRNSSQRGGRPRAGGGRPSGQGGQNRVSGNQDGPRQPSSSSGPSASAGRGGPSGGAAPQRGGLGNRRGPRGGSGRGANGSPSSANG